MTFPRDPERRIEPPEGPPLNICPICGAEVNNLVRSAVTYEVIGCEDCVVFFDPREE